MKREFIIFCDVQASLLSKKILLYEILQVSSHYVIFSLTLLQQFLRTKFGGNMAILAF